LAASGGVVALFLTGMISRCSAAMGFISDSRRFPSKTPCWWSPTRKKLRRQGESAESAARSGSPAAGCRPVLMASSVAMLGLLPAALSRGIGSETQKPLAIVVIGGALALVILPRLLHACAALVGFRKRVPAPHRSDRPPSASPALRHLECAASGSKPALLQFVYDNRLESCHRVSGRVDSPHCGRTRQRAVAVHVALGVRR